MQDLPWGTTLRNQRLQTSEQLLELVTEVSKRPALIYLYSPQCYYSQVGAIDFEKAINEMKTFGEPLGRDVPSGEYFASHVYIYNAVPMVATLLSKNDTCVTIARFKSYLDNVEELLKSKEKVTSLSKLILEEFTRLSNLYRSQRIDCMSKAQFQALAALLQQIDPDTTNSLEAFFKEFASDVKPAKVQDIFDDPVRRAHIQFQEIILGEPITHYPMIVGLSFEGRVIEYDGPVNAEALYIFMAGLFQT